MDKLNTSPATGQVAEGAVDQNPVIPDPTAAPSGSATQGVATPPAQASEDQKRIEALEKKYEQDIARIKSTFDKRDADQKKLLQQREEEFNRKLRELEVRGMDDATRKQYEESHKQEEFQRIAQENSQLQQKLQEAETIRSYQQFFIDSGVSLKDLTLDEGPEALAASGWQAIRNQKQQLEEELKRYKSGQPPAEKVLPEPPDTMNHNDKAASPTRLAEAIKKYAGGDEEKFYQGLQNGSIPTSVLNLKKE